MRKESRMSFKSALLCGIRSACEALVNFYVFHQYAHHSRNKRGNDTRNEISSTQNITANGSKEKSAESCYLDELDFHVENFKSHSSELPTMCTPIYPLLKNVHAHLKIPTDGETYLTRLDYFCHHYKCDGFDDTVS